jgi:hypothetical protein
MRKALELGGLVTGPVLVVFGIVVIAMDDNERVTEVLS